MPNASPIMIPIDKTVPKGEFCYTILKIADGEILSNDIARFGYDLREFKYHNDAKEVLCPYWNRTNHGTIRCDKLDLEVYDEDICYADARKLALEHFGEAEIDNRVKHSSLLAEEIKVCDINLEDD
jgi:hypothetical protein